MQLSKVQRAWPALVCLLAACADEHLASLHDASHGAGAAATYDAGAVVSEAEASTDAGTVSNAGSDAALSCDEQSRASSDAIRAVWAAADNHCSSDDDCVSVWLGTACYASCAVLTSKAGSAQVTQAAEAQRGTICAGFAERGCKLAALPCIAPPPFACVAGACRSFTYASNASDSAPSQAAASISDNHTGTAIRLGVQQKLNLTLHTVGPGSYGDPQLSAAALSFVQSSYPTPQPAGGPTQLYEFQAVAKGELELVIPHSTHPDPFKLTIAVR